MGGCRSRGISNGDGRSVGGAGDASSHCATGRRTRTRPPPDFPNCSPLWPRRPGLRSGGGIAVHFRPAVVVCRPHRTRCAAGGYLRPGALCGAAGSRRRREHPLLVRRNHEPCKKLWTSALADACLAVSLTLTIGAVDKAPLYRHKKGLSSFDFFSFRGARSVVLCQDI